MATQLPLNFAVAPAFGIEDFLVAGSNAVAFGMIEGWPDWPASLLLLSGPAGSGKSHLAAILAERAKAIRLTGTDLESIDVPRLATEKLLIIEGADRIEDENTLFHLVNSVREHGHQMLMTARSQPDHWGLKLPDLLSRLRLSPVIEIGPPDDALFRSLLAKLLHDRQISVEPTVIEYLTMRSERSYAAARRLVELLDFHSLARGRRITKVIAAEVLGMLEQE